MTPTPREEAGYIVEYQNRMVYYREHDLKKLQASETNTVNLGELKYKVKCNVLFKGWVAAVKKTKNGTRYRVLYEDKASEELTLEELNDTSSVTLNRTKCPSAMAITKRARRRNACGNCKQCRRRDCGQCRQCKDKPIFGGEGKLKERCIKRRCEAMS